MTDTLRQVGPAFDAAFEIERELGRGTIACVYAAYDLVEDRRVALKVLFPELTSTVGEQRFEREIRIGCSLSHPHIVPIYRSGRANGYLYFTMPLLEGESLAQRLDRERQLRIDEALEITRQVAGALHHAHPQGVIHRDIKPQNIMLTPGGAVTMDFGIAALSRAGGADRLTAAGLAMGTPDYMSPEQATGEDRIDGRADQYSLACVLYEMLAGHAPFQGSSSQTILTRHARDPVPSLASARPAVSPALEAVIARALAKLPDERFATVATFVDALDVAEHGVAPRGMAPLTAPARKGSGRIARFIAALWARIERERSRRHAAGLGDDVL